MTHRSITVVAIQDISPYIDPSGESPPPATNSLQPSTTRTKGAAFPAHQPIGTIRTGVPVAVGCMADNERARSRAAPPLHAYSAPRSRTATTPSAAVAAVPAMSAASMPKSSSSSAREAVSMN